MAQSILVSPYGLSTESLPAGTHFIAENVRYAPLSDEHKSRIVDYLDAVGEEQLSKRVRGRSVFVVPVSEIAALRTVTDPLARADYALHLHRFALEYFADVSVPVAAFALDDGEVVSHVHEPTDLRTQNAETTLSSGSWEKHATYLEFLYKSLSKAPMLRLAVTRICRAFRQGPVQDGVIDLAIGLECLVAAQVEIKFQFSLFHAIISSDDKEQRKLTFTLLQNLYDVRSLTVHGGNLDAGGKRKNKVVSDSWDSLIRLSRANLTYYLLFCDRQNSKEWQEHLRDIAMGGIRVKAED